MSKLRFLLQDGRRIVGLIQVDSFLEYVPTPDYFPIGADPLTKQPVWEGDSTWVACGINDGLDEIPF